MPGFSWNITSVFFGLIVGPNRRAALAKGSVILFVSLIECAMSAQSSANSRSRTSSSVILVLAFRRCRLNMFQLVRRTHVHTRTHTYTHVHTCMYYYNLPETN